MKSVIVGTAGHIDHGKTALVKALTGIDADRLEEEKRRGITIDIGFAHLELPAPDGETLRLGFVDVPGHERFVRNMLAGIGGIDLVLLVIAADESIKPQTREHFDICRLLGVRGGIAVLTKSDLVDPDTLDVVRLEVEDFLRGSLFAAPSKIVAVSSVTGAGLDDLRRALAQSAAEVAAKDSAALPRLPIDRVFSLKGFGTVVTGTLVSGTICVEDELDVFPSQRRVRVRGVQVHGTPAERAVAGERTALNLPGVTTEDLRRGMTLTPPATFQPTSRLDVKLSLLPAVRALKDGAKVHFHAYTAESVATVAVIAGKSIAPGQEAFARLALPEATLLLPGDRFIIRQFSPVVTIGGGIVLDACPLPKVRKDKSRGEEVEFLKFAASGDPARILESRIARRGVQGLSTAQLVAETGWRMEIIASHLSAMPEIVQVGGRCFAAVHISALQTALLAAMTDFHKQSPLVAGINKEALKEKFKTSPEAFDATLDTLIREKKLEAVGEVVRLAGRGVVMKDEEAASKAIIEAAFASAGLQVPSLKETLAGLKIDQARAQKIVTLLLRDKTLVKISGDLIFHRTALDGLRKVLATEKSKSAQIDVARFKQMTGVSRKYAIPLLEYLDRERVTRRVGDERVIL